MYIYVAILRGLCITPLLVIFGKFTIVFIE
jgi:hypothetical protein